MKFQFRLERMLHLIRLRETVKKMEVSSVQKRLAFMTQRSETLRSDMRLLLERIPRELEAAPYAMAQVQASSHELSQLAKLMAEEAKTLERRKRELSRLMMRRKAVEALREKKYREHRLDQSRREQKSLDETSLRRRWETG